MSGRILVTGASGYLGSHIADALEGDGLAVIRANRTDANLTDALVVRALLEKHTPTHVVHAAGLINGSIEQLTAANEIASTVLGREIAETNADVVLIALGSAAEYGFPATEDRIAEDSVCNPVSDYGRSKLAATASLRELADSKELRLNIIRPFNPVAAPLSPNQVLGAFIKKAAEAKAADERVVQMGPLGAIRDFFNADHLSALVKAMIEAGCQGEIVNACSGQPRQVRDLVNYLNSLDGGGFEIDETVANNIGPPIIGDPAKMLAYVSEAAEPDIEGILRRAWAMQMG